MNKIKEFIECNGLDFTGSGSELNGNCVILAGYTLYENFAQEDLDEIINDFSFEAYQEFERVYNYAKKKNYGEIWKTEDYKKKYTY